MMSDQRPTMHPKTMNETSGQTFAVKVVISSVCSELRPGTLIGILGVISRIFCFKEETAKIIAFLCTVGPYDKKTIMSFATVLRLISENVYGRL